MSSSGTYIKWDVFLNLYLYYVFRTYKTFRWRSSNAEIILILFMPLLILLLSTYLYRLISKCKYNVSFRVPTPFRNTGL